jgi:transcriptional regulator with XRE-family HTH domain
MSTGIPIFPTSGRWSNERVKQGGDNPRTFGERLKSARKAARLTQAQLAELAGIGQPQVSDLEGDDYEASVATAQLAHATGVEGLWLATGKGPRKRVDALNVDALTEIIIGVEIACHGRQAAPEKRAKLVAALYRSHSKNGTVPDSTEILELLRTML